MANWLSSILNPGKAYKKAHEAMIPYYNQAQAHLQPYAEHGNEAYGHLNTAMQDLMNPAALNDRFMNDYEMSDAAKFAQGRTQQSTMNALSQMGLLGSTPGLRALQAGESEIAAQDEQRYMERMIQQYLQGAGLAQGMYGQGANASGAMANNANQMGTNAAEMAYNRQAAPGQMFSNLLGTAANLGGAYMGYQGANNLANAWKSMGGQAPLKSLPAYMGGTGYSAGGY